MIWAGHFHKLLFNVYIERLYLHGLLFSVWFKYLKYIIKF